MRSQQPRSRALASGSSPVAAAGAQGAGSLGSGRAGWQVTAPLPPGPGRPRLLRNRCRGWIVGSAGKHVLRWSRPLLSENGASFHSVAVATGSAVPVRGSRAWRRRRRPLPHPPPGRAPGQMGRPYFPPTPCPLLLEDGPSLEGGWRGPPGRPLLRPGARGPQARGCAPRGPRRPGSVRPSEPEQKGNAGGGRGALTLRPPASSFRNATLGWQPGVGEARDWTGKGAVRVSVRG